MVLLLALADLPPAHVQRALNDWTAAGAAPATVERRRATLRTALSTAERWGLVNRNVAKLAEPPRARPVERTPLTPEETGRLLDAVKGHRLAALYTLTATTGLRRGEILGLRWQDVDLDGRTLVFRSTLQRLAGAWRLDEPKSARSKRTVPLSALTVARLREHRARQGRERIAVGPEWVDPFGGLVFTGPFGAPLEGTEVTKQLQRILAGAGLPRQRFHDLRHGAASLLLDQGLNIREVADLLGHSSVSLTLSVYGHVLPGAKRAPADAMDRLFGVD